MRLKALSVVGYKSFANRTRFAFPSGLTAVVGPNGSGKSNVADAVRWVLGEGRASALRARSADDLIFAGTDRRARSGLAEVSIVLDNEDGWLAIEYPEIVITRRIHRDGQSAFFVNDSPVRLRDVHDLLGGRLGPSNFTVVGQGVVDRFLTLSTAQRREFIDEAAGIQPLQRRRDRSLRRLAETHENMTRVSDILAEIGPRLRRMERLAERAARHREVSEALREHLTAWYAHHVQRAHLDHHAARTLRQQADLALAEAHAATETARTAMAEASRGSDESEAALDRRRAEREASVAALAEARQRAAVARAQHASLEARRLELEAAIETARDQGVQLTARRDALAVERAARDREHDAAAARVAAAEAGLAAVEGERAQRAQALETVRGERLEASGRLATERARRAAAEEAQSERQRECQRLAAALAAAVAGDAALDAEASQLAGALAAAVQALTEASAGAAMAEAAVTEASAELAAAREAHATARTTLENLRTRDRSLAALASELAGAEGVAETLVASQVALLGTLGEVIEVAEGWDAAVAAALEARVHAVVVADIDDADRAVVALEVLAEARAVVVPLAGGRPGAGWRADADARAAGDVCASARAGLVDVLLGDTAFTDDLAAARRAVARANGPTRAAARDGTVVECNGTTRLGSPGRELFAVERERRALPAALSDAELSVAESAAALDHRTDARRTAEGTLADAVRARAACETARASLLERSESAAAAVDRARREREWRAEALAQAEAARDRLGADIAELTAAIEREVVHEAASRAAEGAALSAMEATDPTAPRAERDGAAAALGVLAEGRAAAVARAESAARDASAAAGRLAEAERAMETVSGDLAALVERAAIAEHDIARHATVLGALDDELGSAAEATAAARSAARELSSTLEARRERMASLEGRLAESRLVEARAEDRLQRLAEQREHDMALVAGDPEGDASEATTPEPGAIASDDASRDGDAAGLPAADEPAGPDVAEPAPLPDDIDATIQGLRRELHQIGAIDREALTQYEETAARHADLSDQLADLTAADRDIRAVIETLETEMATRFEATFSAVAEAFARYFPRLFGGGEAELTMVAPDEGGEDEPRAPGPPGIDIEARPPGKRRQPLSLLSGGERSLTAVALTFALLEVSGTPFALLDEVDAALDEANVDRFRGCLRDLAERIQIVVITHNRATVQAADAIYGVTMGADGASRTVSLRVSDVA